MSNPGGNESEDSGFQSSCFTKHLPWTPRSRTDVPPVGSAALVKFQRRWSQNMSFIFWNNYDDATSKFSNNFAHLARYLAARPKHGTHLLWKTSFAPLRSSEKLIIWRGNFDKSFTYPDPYVVRQLIPSISVGNRPFLWLVFLQLSSKIRLYRRFLKPVASWW